MDDLGFSSYLYKPPSLLPIAKHQKALLYLVENHPVTIVVGQTGSGKTTQLPRYLYDAGWTKDGKVIACTQPRRVAATSVAARVAEEMGVRLGDEVGYSIRFEDMTSEKTRIKYLTDGLLLREALIDPLLSRYSVIMVDEAHERSLSTDILLGILKKIRRKRPDLRIIISSATLQAEDFVRFFSTTPEGKEPEKNNGKDIAKIISIEGRCHPVDILYLSQPTENYIESIMSAIFEIHLKEPQGDILVFLPGQADITNCIELLSERAAKLHPAAPKLLPLPLYAGLPSSQQLEIFEPTPENYRKVVFSTNIAEASLTIPAIHYVLDSGLVKLRTYNPQTGIDTLTTVPTSRASAVQRAGRAGRVAPGKCFRMYTEPFFNDQMIEAAVPEIQRSNLAPVVLQLKALGVENVAKFEFLTAPPAELMIRALELLFGLGAVDAEARLTKPTGVRMAEMPVGAMMAKAILSSIQFRCTDEILIIAAMTSAGNIFITDYDNKKAGESQRRKFAVEEGDHLTLLNVFTAFQAKTNSKNATKWCHDHLLNFKSLQRAVSIRNQLKRYLEKFKITNYGNKEVTGEMIRRCLASGYFANAARMQPDGTFVSVGGGVRMWAHPSSVMFNRRCDWVVFNEVVEMGGKIYIRDVTSIEKDWLVEYAPEYYRFKETVKR
ncbi:P-loop containing nucleoside triphosphate hydrolase protein [Ascobolus immersus RN42]|uniref:RNA helicase n=1 Tax=Ascobolus immersus RN42 TaxID=1160509 RepID=A0A3N4I1D4_ASCIM|nr:P-loop containing nucleoside triphosphate hydrolase protein [Ascobolus immersus RN42]